jgi:hypothetical protein
LFTVQINEVIDEDDTFEEIDEDSEEFEESDDEFGESSGDETFDHARENGGHEHEELSLTLPQSPVARKKSGAKKTVYNLFDASLTKSLKGESKGISFSRTIGHSTSKSKMPRKKDASIFNGELIESPLDRLKNVFISFVLVLCTLFLFVRWTFPQQKKAYLLL